MMFEEDVDREDYADGQRGPTNRDEGKTDDSGEEFDYNPKPKHLTDRIN